MSFVSKRRLIVIGMTGALAIIVGVVFSWLSGVAVVLAVVTVLLLRLGARFGLDTNVRMGRAWGRDVFGSDEPKRRR
jgi:hypothetical protein